jgi:hypothetical protein
MGRYETFVIRIWVDDSPSANHGEIRHLGTSMGLRFIEVQEALRFIERFSRDLELERRQTSRSKKLTAD